MRTVDEIKAEMVNEDSGDSDWIEQAQNEGLNDGFRKAIKMVETGATNADIKAAADMSQRSYKSYGDDAEDARQMGYETALRWAAEEFDWDENGNPVERDSHV